MRHKTIFLNFSKKENKTLNFQSMYRIVNLELPLSFRGKLKEDFRQTILLENKQAVTQAYK